MTKHKVEIYWSHSGNAFIPEAQDLPNKLFEQDVLANPQTAIGQPPLSNFARPRFRLETRPASQPLLHRQKHPRIALHARNRNPQSLIAYARIRRHFQIDLVQPGTHTTGKRHPRIQTT